MSTTAHHATTQPSLSVSLPIATAGRADAPSRQAFQLLYLGFIAAPLLAGADKFVGLLTDWERYLAPLVARLSPLSAQGTLRTVGVVEMLAGLVVALRPRLGAYVVAAWLCGVIVNLLLLGQHFDVALRDFGLVLAALALARLSERHAGTSA
ncbi:MAG: hypothetical protein JWN48_352 [Myxococcaceae bacterium]|nr:hypothetical protein [Myxococcaceae bacterium]